MNTKRPIPLTIASILLAFLSLGSLSLPLFGHPPPLVTSVAIVLGILGLVAAFGLWKLKRWGMILAIIYSVLQVLSGAAGIVGAPNVLKVLTIVTVVLCIVIIVLVVLPSARRAYAAERVRVAA
jgi:hypothetical protein